MIPGNVVQPATEEDARAIGRTCYGETTTESLFEVLVYIAAGADYHGTLNEPAIIVRKCGERYGYPFVWNASRWTVVETPRPCPF